MKKICSSRPVLALGGLVAAAALLAGVPHAQAQAPAPGAALSGAGSFPNSFIVPGTNTSLHVGGFVELDTYYDTSAFGNASSIGAIDNFGVTSTELEGTGIAGNPAGHTNHGAWRWTAQNSRVDLETRTPSPYGEIKTFIEMDFGGSVGSLSGVNGTATAATGTLSAPVSQFTGARLKQAYGTLGPWLFGQAASNFADLAAWPDTLDAPVEAGGEMGVAEFRQPQIRYTQLFPGGISASGSVESFASSGEFATAHSGAGPVNWNDFNASSFSEHLPAVTGTVRIDQPWGHAAFHVAVAEEEFRSLGLSSGLPPAATDTTLPNGGHLSAWGYQTSFTGHLNTIGKDKFTWQLAYGQGASQYTWAGSAFATQWDEGLICSVTAATNSVVCSQPRVMGVNVGYSHWWTDTWRSGLAFGYDQVSKPNAAGDWLAATAGGGLSTLAHHDYSATGNLLWTPVAGVQLGLEYEWVHRTVWSGAHGGDNRIKGQALFSF